MRILVASGIVAPEIGGPATYLEGLRPELEGRGHEVRVLAYGDAMPGVSAGRVDRVPRGPLALRLARYAVAYARGAGWADVVLVLSLALPRPRRAHARVALRVAGDYAWERSMNRGWIAPHEELEGFQAKRHRWRVEAIKGWRSREARQADLVIVPSDYLHGVVLGWGVDPRRVEVIPNAVCPDGAAAASTRADARRRLGWEVDGRYVLAAARLTRWKGIELVIDAVAGLGDVRLVVAGDGPLRAALTAQAAACGAPTTFCGALPRETLALHLRAADYLVVYSGYEGLSHTILEALTLGTPVIASRRGGNPEVVRDDGNGLLVAHPDAAALAAALRRAFAPGVRERLAAATATGLERFDWRRFAERTCRTLVGLASGSPAGAEPGVASGPQRDGDP